MFPYVGRSGVGMAAESGSPAAGTVGGAELIEILLVEDDPGDVAYTREVLAELRLRNRLTVLNNGLHALRYLRGEFPYEDAPRPDLVLLDLILPIVDGRTVLDELRTRPAWRHTVVAVLTTSRAEEQMLRRMGVPAEHFLYKPVDFDRLVEVVRRTEGFWIEVGSRR
jgi:CheY-like chemotaxis protein